MQISGSAFSFQYAMHSSSSVQSKQQKPKGEEELFAKADSNGDGKVDQSEMASLLAQLTASKPADGQNSNGTGGQPPSMSEKDLAALFAEADSDGDGLLSLEDFSAFGEKMRASHAPSAPPPGPPPAGGMPPARSAEEIASLFKDADSDGDGLLSLEEFTALHEKMTAAGQPPAADATDGTSELEALQKMALATQGNLADMLFDNRRSDSPSLSLADLLADTRQNGSSTAGGGLANFIQSLLEKAYQLGQQNPSVPAASASTAVAETE